MEKILRQILLVLLCSAVFVYAIERVAILPCGGDIKKNDNAAKSMTFEIRKAAREVLPEEKFSILTEDEFVNRLPGGVEEYEKLCSDSKGCMAMGINAEVEYIAECRILSFGDMTFKIEIELHSVVNKITSLAAIGDDFKTLMAITPYIRDNAPKMFAKIPGASRTRIAPPSVAGGISGLQSGTDDEFYIERRYLANFATEPAGAVLSFNGVVACTETPCRAELVEGSVRIRAMLDQYETADTTISIKQNNQNVSIRLKPNFGVLEIKPAYLEGIGKNENWNLTINSKAFSSLENRLSPGKYSVKLSHKCYEDISFDVGINKSSREVFDMANYANLKKGGLVLSAEKNGEPVSEPVFVNGVRVGETPFSGSVAVCSDIEIGKAKEKVNVKLEHKQTVRYVHKVQTYGTFTDLRDGKKYKTVKIGNQIWMAENLSYALNGSKCYGNNSENCKKYGRLYDWNAAMKACPSGWHLPSNGEWNELGDEKIAGEKLKAKSGWNDNGNGTDEYGFSALPGGIGYSDGSFSVVGDFGSWWSAYEDHSDYAYSRTMRYYGTDAYWYSNGKSFLFSVRCVQGPPIYEPPTYKQPVYEPPAYEPPTYEQPVYEQPAYETPTYEQPNNTHQMASWAPEKIGLASIPIDSQLKIKKPSNKSFWVAFALDITGAAFVYYGYEMDKVVMRRYEDYASLGSSATKSEFDNARAKVEDAKTKRNVFYILGSIFLATGIGVHIWF